MQRASRQLLWPKPHRDGTVLVLRASAGSLGAKIAGGGRAAGRQSVTVNWGDGTVETLPEFRNAEHVYARPGVYTVWISDDLKSFGYTWNGGRETDSYRGMLLELVRIGDRVTELAGHAFNNCHNMRGSVVLQNVTNLGGYAFGSIGGVTDIVIPSVKTLSSAPFFCGVSATSVYADGAEHIDSYFGRDYGNRIADLYLRGLACERISAMAGFPFGLKPGVRIHGSNGILLCDGTIIGN